MTKSKLLEMNNVGIVVESLIFWKNPDKRNFANRFRGVDLEELEGGERIYEKISRAYKGWFKNVPQLEQVFHQIESMYTTKQSIEAAAIQEWWVSLCKSCHDKIHS